MSPRILIILLLLKLTIGAHALPSRGESFRELRKLMRQEQEDEQAAQTKQFNADIYVWAQSLEELGTDFVNFVETCRRRHSHCDQRRVQRKIRMLRRRYRELHAELEALEIRFAGKISDEGLLEPTMQAVEEVLKQYDTVLRRVTAETYKLVDQ